MAELGEEKKSDLKEDSNNGNYPAQGIVIFRLRVVLLVLIAYSEVIDLFDTKFREQCDFLFGNTITFFISFIALMCEQFYIDIME